MTPTRHMSGCLARSESNSPISNRHFERGVISSGSQRPSPSSISSGARAACSMIIFWRTLSSRVSKLILFRQ